MGGLLIQEQDTVVENDQAWQVVTERQPTPAERDALNFAWKAVKHVKSNAIVLANESQTVGIGAGQMNRIGSVKIAVDQAQAAGKLQGAVLASDAFSPWQIVWNTLHNMVFKQLFSQAGALKTKHQSI